MQCRCRSAGGTGQQGGHVNHLKAPVGESGEHKRERFNGWPPRQGSTARSRDVPAVVGQNHRAGLHSVQQLPYSISHRLMIHEVLHACIPEHGTKAGDVGQYSHYVIGVTLWRPEQRRSRRTCCHQGPLSPFDLRLHGMRLQ